MTAKRPAGDGPHADDGLPARPPHELVAMTPQPPAAEPPADPAPWPEVDWVSPDTTIDLPPVTGWYAPLKPSLDFLLALSLLPVALPLIAVCYALVRLSSRGPGFYVQTRSGLGGRPYPIIKLRTMGHNCEAKTGIQWSQKGDRRVTRLGKFLRASHLDELPQIFNVLRGEMSLVGPRPERPEVIAAKGLARQVPGYAHRLDVKPGVTGFAQIQLPPDSDLTSVRRKVAYDLYYIRHQSLLFDLRLIAATGIKTLGVTMPTLRRLFFLERREVVGRHFRSLVPTPPPLADGSPARLQPV
jgi:lipopolysaccharide/colanic/teichoic acid biosynthesis glycosyltransferase